MTRRMLAGLLVLGMTLTAFSFLVPALAAASPSPPPGVATNPASLAPDLGWQTPFPIIASAPSSANLGGVALGGDQSGMIVWERSAARAVIMATRFVPGGGAAGTDWEVPVQISTGSCNSWSPTVGMDGTGHAIAVWYDSCHYAIHATRYTPGSGWTAPVGIDQPYWYSLYPQIAMNSAGVAFVTWEAWDGSRYRVLANRFVPSSGWGTAVLVESTLNYTGNANVAVDAAGDAMITYHEYDGSTYHIYAVRFDSTTAAWGNPVMLEPAANYAIYPTVSMDHAGNAFVAWIEWDGSAYSVYANHYVPGTGWGSAVAVESQSNWPFFQSPRVSANNGSAVVAWTMYGPGTDPYSVWANRFTAGAWGTEADVDIYANGPSYGAAYPAVALDAAGNATIAFQFQYLSATPPNQVQMYSVRYSALTGSVLSVNAIDYSRISPGTPIIAMDPLGNALVTWNYNDNAQVTPYRNGILANRYTAGTGWRYYPAQNAEWDESLSVGWLQMESNAAGDAIFSWTQNDGPIWNGYAALYTPGQGWGPETRIENLDTNNIQEEWSAIDGSGNALVIFRMYVAGAWSVYGVYYSTSTGWGSPQRIDTFAGDNFWLRVAMSSTGDGVAVYNQWNGTNWNLYGVHFDGTTKTWGTETALQTSSIYVGTAAVAMNDNGDAVAVYNAWDGSTYSNYAVWYTAGVGWGSPQLIEQSSNQVSAPYVALNDNGDAVASYGSYGGSYWQAVGTTYSPATGWTASQTFETIPGDAGVAVPSIDGQGNGMIAYQVFENGRWAVYVAPYTAGTGWGTPVKLNSGGGDALDITTALNFRGDGYASWAQFNGATWDILARRYVAGEGWMPTSIVDTVGTDSGSTTISVDGAGNAMLGWNQWSHDVLIPFAASYIVGDGLPRLTVASPADGTLTRDSTVVVSGSTDPGRTVTIDGAAVSVAADGSFAKTFTLVDGTHTFRVVANDAAGMTTTVTRSVTVDTTAPSLSLSAPSSGSLTRNPVAQVTGTTEPGATVNVNGIAAAVSPSGAFSVSVALSEGSNTITATATDAVGNSATTSVQVTLDTIAPSLSIGTPSGGLTNNANVVVAGTTDAGATVTVDGTAVTVDSSGAFTTTVPLPQGAHTFTVIAQDAAGNQAKATVSVTVDTTPPTISITSPSADATVTTAAVTVTGTTEPGATVDVNGYTVIAGSTGSFSVELPLAAGSNTITVTATDAAGNSASASVTVTYADPLPAAQSSIATLNTMSLLLIVLVIASLALGVFEMLQVRKLRSRGSSKPPEQKPGPPPPEDEL